ncbi:MAG: hypothetical protein ACLU9Q_09130 [Marvinbryantia sp.]|uniref:hypothetical protein n=1 Tax=Marvinbryantia sp. TaxID=2496532 RepID=UPI0025D5A5FA|nr:hypothetical protein [uncultured Marvinbryantia sp.]
MRQKLQSRWQVSKNWCFCSLLLKSISSTERILGRKDFLKQNGRVDNMKNPRTSGPVKTSSVRAGNRNDILSPLDNINIPVGKMDEKSKVIPPSDDGAIGWIKG